MQLGARTTGGIASIAVATGGRGYTAPPTVTVSGGGGTGVTAYAVVASGRVASVCIAAVGSGHTGNPTVSFSGGGGTGAAATAYAATAARPMTFFRGRYNDVYGVDGMGRGVRWDGAATTVQAIGMNPPSTAPSVTAGTSSAGGYVKSVQIIDGGNGYHSTPSVSFTGGTPTTTAAAEAVLQNGRVTAIKLTERGAGYQATPAVTISGGLGTGASFTASVLGAIDNARIVAPGSGYDASTVPPEVILYNTNGLTGALVVVDVDEYGRIGSATVLSSGTGATTSGVTAAITGAGTGAQIALDLRYSLSAVTVANSGSGFYTPPAVTVRPAASDTDGFGGDVTAAINSSGQITGGTVVSGGAYSAAPSVLIDPSTALAQAELAPPFRGTYQCCIRYLDSTPPAQNGPVASSISPIAEVNAGGSAGRLTWAFSHGPLDDRVSAMELWRTTSGQSVILFRVATISRTDPQFTTSYVDTMVDGELSDPTRDGYALMPVTLPSGQVNARRFGVPPGEFSVGCMFQDRAWYAVDATGQRPNALVFSEVDEPESVPEINEIVVQENTGEPDKITALVPLGGNLLIAQTAHLYKLAYVAQPVIDASIILVASRGVLNSRCWASMGGVVFLADSQGMYAFDGNTEEAISVAVDNYWREGLIDFSKADKFHVSADAQTKVVRFYYCESGDTESARALCYCLATRSWWAETYASPVTATCRATVGNKLQLVAGHSGAFRKSAGTTDDGTAVPYQIRTGAMSLQNAATSRSIDVLFSPTASDSQLNLALHYNNSQQPRANAISSDRGGAFVVTAGGTAAQLNLKKTRSALGDASGQARAYFSGRVDDRSVGADRHVAVALSGEQSDSSVVIHSLAVDGAS